MHYIRKDLFYMILIFKIHVILKFMNQRTCLNLLKNSAFE